ncbi:MAG: Holliday junction resolvase RuvX [bacterium]|nr:Holliday junction resolvase RuvX [bacterium]
MKQKFLGIDYGDKRVGLAIAEDGSIALPYKVLQNNNLENLLEQLKEVIQIETISLLVIGLPHSLSGQENERCKITRNFVNFLKSNLDIKIETVDEQFSSQLYQKQGVVKDIDKYAATEILDTFLAIRHG